MAGFVVIAVAAVVTAAVHLTGAVEAIAPVFGAVGTVLTATDKVVADATGLRAYLAKRRAEAQLKKVLPVRPVTIPTKAPKQ